MGKMREGDVVWSSMLADTLSATTAGGRHPRRPIAAALRSNFGALIRAYARSNRSRFITLCQAATKSRTNFSFASSQA